jgi:hypothetical protein
MKSFQCPPKAAKGRRRAFFVHRQQEDNVENRAKIIIKFLLTK